MGAAASRRNSGSIQHPFDPVMTELHVETLEHYRGLDGLDLPEAPAGVLMLAPEPGTLRPVVEELAGAPARPRRTSASDALLARAGVPAALSAARV